MAKTNKRRRIQHSGDNFYRYPRWRKARRDALEYYHGLCQECRKRGKVTPAVLVHHDIPRKERPDLAYDLFTPDGRPQLIPLCFACHERIEHERGNRGINHAASVSDEWW